MDSDRLNKWLTLAANIGVIAGIVFLALELRQNNELLDSQARANLVSGRAIYQAYIAGNSGGIADIIVKSRDSELTDTERFRLNVHWDLVLTNWASMYQEVSSGPLHETDLPIGSWVRAYSNPGLRDTWKFRKDEYPADFVQFFDEVIATEYSNDSSATQ